MKKVMFSAFAALAFAFTMTACNNNQAAEATEDTAAVVAEECDHHCMHEGDSAMCCKAEAAVEGEACEHKCQEAEGHKCCKAEGKECEHKCQKAE